MGFDAKAISLVIAEMNRTLQGGRIRKVLRPSRHLFLFQVESFSRKWALLVSIDPSRLVFTMTGWSDPDIQIMSSAGPDDPLTLQFRKYLKDGKIRLVHQHQMDRVCCIDIEKVDDGGNHYLTTVITELTGRSSNLIMVEGPGDKVIAAAVYHPPTGPQARPVIPGSSYVYPVAPASRFVDVIDDSVMLPSMANEGKAGEAVQCQKIFSIWIGGQRAKSLDLLRNRVDRVLKKIQDKALLKKKRMQAELDEIHQTMELRIKADSIMSSLHIIGTARGSIEIPDCHRGGNIPVDLDPSRTAVECANLLYKRARRLDSRSRLLKPLIETEEGILSSIELFRYDLSQQEDTQGISDVSASVLESLAGHLLAVLPISETTFLRKLSIEGESFSPISMNRSERSGRKRGGVRSRVQRSCRVRRAFIEPDIEILIGTNSIQNHNLVFRIAGREDLWFHAREIPGSHIIARRTNGVEITSSDPDYDHIIGSCGMLAAFFSKGRESGRVVVQYTNRKYLKKPGTFVPGLVIVTREETISSIPCIPDGMDLDLIIQ
ncbi:MAG: hypothetical protein CVV64_00735 [Candidatus Wallbacteria bacterium HGW-Wallbacteria-1]|jgi:predicted ribosome quality control (RQC) complex YloA/Tae2 family protein|uniref:NFACT RNA-binding domain-containing protein n=1 Tax=Candidatus Wallbacteria bacterium HGW-Wallbacteria-1 TaxID=2013854 RepID=A0A2N1PUJ5_9BACT|nr:MAG: hypothetical protein CVV64_00735 [Candidatus Wallbacteria bacterium HGW-Wallbacteria-1]